MLTVWMISAYVCLALPSGAAAVRLTFFHCRNATNQTLTLTINDCSPDKVISFITAEVGYDPQWKPKGKSRCSWQNATCTRSIMNHEAIMRCKGQRYCSFSQTILDFPQGSVKALCAENQDANFINIKFNCIAATTTTTTTTLSVKMTANHTGSATTLINTASGTAADICSTCTSSSPRTTNPDEFSDEDAAVGTTTIVGIVVGVCVLLLVIAVAVFIICRYRTGKLCQKSKPSTNKNAVDDKHGKTDSNSLDNELDTYGVPCTVVGWPSLEPDT